MGLFARLFGRRPAGPARGMRQTTVEHPLVLVDPVIGFLNFKGARAAAFAAADRGVLGPLFADSRVAENSIPGCQVLFIYCDVDAQGRVLGAGAALREIVRASGASVAVVASENAGKHLFTAMRAQAGDAWPANVVLTLDRRGAIFMSFYAKLFEEMFRGTSMLLAWVKLAPQMPGSSHPDCPEGILLPEAGHVVFARSG